MASHDLPTWRPGATQNPGFQLKHADGSPLEHTALVEVLAFFSTPDAVLAKFSLTDRAGFLRVQAVTEQVSGQDVPVLRFPMDHSTTEAWPAAGTVRLVIKVVTNSQVFLAPAHAREVFDEKIAVLRPGETTAL